MTCFKAFNVMNGCLDVVVFGYNHTGFNAIAKHIACSFCHLPCGFSGGDQKNSSGEDLIGKCTAHCFIGLDCVDGGFDNVIGILPQFQIHGNTSFAGS